MTTTLTTTTLKKTVPPPPPPPAWFLLPETNSVDCCTSRRRLWNARVVRDDDDDDDDDDDVEETTALKKESSSSKKRNGGGGVDARRRRRPRRPPGEETKTTTTKGGGEERSLARRAAEKHREKLLLMRKEEASSSSSEKEEKKKEEEEEEEDEERATTKSRTTTLRAYATENAQLREALRKSVARARRLETELEETTESLSACEGALKDARVSHRALQKDSRECRARDRDALKSLRKTLEERERISRGERARCGRALRYAMDCLRAHAPLMKDERNEGGSVLGSVVAELARLTEIAASAGDFGFREYGERNDGEDVHVQKHTAYKNLRTREETEDKDEAERAHQRHVDAMREAKTKITRLEDERKHLLQTLEDATHPIKEYNTAKESIFTSTPTSRDEFLFDRHAMEASATHEKATKARIEKTTFALPGADALARDIDAIDAELKKLASAFEDKQQQQRAM